MHAGSGSALTFPSLKTRERAHGSPLVHAGLSFISEWSDCPCGCAVLEIIIFVAAGRPLDLAAAVKPDCVEPGKSAQAMIDGGSIKGRWGLPSNTSGQDWGVCVYVRSRSNDVISYCNQEGLSLGGVLERLAGPLEAGIFKGSVQHS